MIKNLPKETSFEKLQRLKNKMKSDNSPKNIEKCGRAIERMAYDETIRQYRLEELMKNAELKDMQGYNLYDMTGHIIISSIKKANY